ncbi:hypothetical protein [Marinobacter sp.]|uniref:hypothetical protein n=1 Tax=Marinobacter sp. TaxID=50741 RepID=UPI003A908441
MSKSLNLTPHMAAAVRSSLVAVEFEKGNVQIDFDPIDVFVSDEGWITVRDGPHGFEEHEDLRAFESAYKLQDPDPDLLALAYEMEAMYEGFLLNADEEGNDLARSIWCKRRDRCRSAIAKSIAKPE